MKTKFEQVATLVIVLCVVIIIGQAIALFKTVSNNKTLRKSLENPVVVEKPVIKYRDRVVYEPKTVTVFKDREKLVPVEKIIYVPVEKETELEYEGGNITFPHVPVLANDKKIKRIGFSAGYNIVKGYGTFGILYCPFNFDLSVMIEYNLNQSLEVKGVWKP